MKSVCLALMLSSVVLVGGGSSASAAPAYVYDKAGVSADRVLSDRQACVKKAERIAVAGAPIVSSLIFGGVLAGVAVGISENIQRGKAAVAAEDVCMRGQRYLRLELTPEEASAYNGAGSKDAKTAWMAAFLAKDWSDRIAAAELNQPQLLPQLQDQPFAVEGVQLDPASLKFANRPLGRGEVLMTGVGGHRETAVLSGDVAATMKGLVTAQLRVAAGAVLHAVDAGGTTAQVQTTLWCGPGVGHVFGKDHESTICLLSTDKGDAALGDGLSPPWLASPELILAQVRPIPIDSGKVELTLADKDQIGPMDVTLTVVDFGDSSVHLKATATRDGKTTPFWNETLKFDSSGRAVLPFWSKRLTMTRESDKLNILVSDDGDGSGWLDPQPVAAKTASVDPASTAR